MKSRKRIKNVALDTAFMLKETRIALGLTQQELADKCGKQQESIARAESGENMPSLSFLQDIAEGLGCNLVPPKFDIINEYVYEKKYKV